MIINVSLWQICSTNGYHLIALLFHKYYNNYNNYCIFKIIFNFQKINGGATLGENIADNGGMREAFYVSN